MAKKEYTNNNTVRKETTIYRQLKDMLGTDTKVYYLMWKFCPEQLKDAHQHPVKTFEDLKNRYKVFSDTITEEVCEAYLLESGCQTAIKWLLKRLHTKKNIELYQKYYDKAMAGDVQAFKAFEDFSEKFFKEDKEGGLTKLLNRIKDEDIEESDDEDYNYQFLN